MGGLTGYITDQDAERDGVWANEWDGFQIRIARVGPMNRTAYKITQKIVKSGRGTGSSPETDLRNTVELCVEGLVKGWRTYKEGEWHDSLIQNLDDPEGPLIPFTKDVLRKVLVAIPDLAADIQYFALQQGNYAREVLDEAVGE